jgi:hypothetical protein
MTITRLKELTDEEHSIVHELTMRLDEALAEAVREVIAERKDLDEPFRRALKHVIAVGFLCGEEIDEAIADENTNRRERKNLEVKTLTPDGH